MSPPIIQQVLHTVGLKSTDALGAVNGLKDRIFNTGNAHGALNPLKLDRDTNYIAVFLTARCNLRCSYCINRERGTNGRFEQVPTMTGRDWITALNRIPATNDLPITLQGGEPTKHPEFYYIVNHVNRPMDLLTNGQFNVKTFIKRVKPNKFKRKAPYPSIRLSFHPENMDLGDTLWRVNYLRARGYQIGLYMIEHPMYSWAVKFMRQECKRMKIDFRTKEFLGKFKNKIYGTYKYDTAIMSPQNHYCLCKGSELIVGPNGAIHRCHSSLYNNRKTTNHILDDKCDIVYDYLKCHHYGSCNTCDIKVTTDRHQKYGHTSVDIKNIT